MALSIMFEGGLGDASVRLNDCHRLETSCKFNSIAADEEVGVARADTYARVRKEHLKAEQNLKRDSKQKPKYTNSHFHPNISYF